MSILKKLWLLVVVCCGFVIAQVEEAEAACCPVTTSTCVARPSHPTPACQAGTMPVVRSEDVGGACDCCDLLCLFDCTACFVGPQGPCTPVIAADSVSDPCDGIDNDCDGVVDEDHVPVPTTCGLGACQAGGSMACVDGAVVDTCAPAQPTAEVFDSLDNDCDGETNECAPGQTDWWCCAQTGQNLLAFNVVPGADTNPAAECAPLSVNSNATCSLRGVFQIADRVADNGCAVTAAVAPGSYSISSELRLSRGALQLVGTDAAVTFVEPAVPAGECTLLCRAGCAEACHPDPFSSDNACLPSCDAACNPARDTQCVQSCEYLVGHRLVNASADPGKQPILELHRLTLRGGRNPNAGASLDSEGGGILVRGSTFTANQLILENNWASGFGAGLAVLSSPSAFVVDSVIRNNFNEQVGFKCEVDSQSTPGGGATARGGGIYVADSVMAIERSAITGNVSSDGGGVAAISSGSLTLTNSTVSGNSAPGRAGGILTQIDTTLEFNTIAFNRAGLNPGNDSNRRGGGLATQVVMGAPARTLRAYGNVIARNFLAGGTGAARSADCSLDTLSPGFVLSRGYNLIGDASADCAALASATDLTNLDPGFAPGQEQAFDIDFEPATTDFLVHALAADSPAVDFYPLAADLDPALDAPPCPPFDQRGLLRSVTGCDIGAYETEASSDGDGDGIADGVDPQPFVYSNDFSDAELFGVTVGTIVDRHGHTVIVHDGPAQSDGVVIAVAGSGGEAVDISACDGSVVLELEPGESTLLTCPRPTSCVFAGELLTARDRADVVSDLFGGSFAVGQDASVFGSAFSLASGWLGERAIIDGDARLGGTLTGNRAGVHGALAEQVFVEIQALIEREVAAGTAPVVVPHEGSQPLSPGSYGHVLVHSRAALTLTEGGVYRFASLTFESDAKLYVAPDGVRTVVAVSGNLILGDRLRMANVDASALTRDQTLFYANGATVDLGHGVAIAGDVEAPFANVELRDGSSVNGCLGGRNVTLGHDSVAGDGGA